MAAMRLGGIQVVRGDQRLVQGCCEQLRNPQLIIPAGLSDLFEALLIAVVAQHVTEEKIADQKPVQVDRHDGFVKSRVTAVGIDTAALGRLFHGFPVAARAGRLGLRAGTDTFTEVRPARRIGGNFLKFLVKYRNADFRDGIEIPKKGGQFFNIEAGNHETSCRRAAKHSEWGAESSVFIFGP